MASDTRVEAALHRDRTRIPGVGRRRARSPRPGHATEAARRRLDPRSRGEHLAARHRRRVGVETVHVAPDGRVVWWVDPTGDERGHWVAPPFEGGGAAPTRRPGFPRHGRWGSRWWAGGSPLASRPTTTTACTSAMVAPSARELYRHAQPRRRRSRVAGRPRWALPRRHALVHPTQRGRRHPASRAASARRHHGRGRRRPRRPRQHPHADRVVAGRPHAGLRQRTGRVRAARVCGTSTPEHDATSSSPTSPARSSPSLGSTTAALCWSGTSMQGTAQLFKVDMTTGSPRTRRRSERATSTTPRSDPTGRSGSKPATRRIHRRSSTPEATSCSRIPTPTAPDGTPLRSLWFENPNGDPIHAFVGLPRR